MRKISKRKLLKAIEIIKCSQQPLLGYQYASATGIGFMAMITSTDLSKFERCSNVADGVTTKIISSFQESDLFVIVPDPYGFELLIDSAERLRRTENSVEEIEIISNREVPKSFKSYLSKARNKTNLVNYIFQQWK